ncbi:hypothetical protein L9F63_013160, partial [Diploptera punctata]
MHSREDIVKILLTKKGVDPFAAGGPRMQTAVHLVASRQTGTATSILRLLLNTAGKDIRLKPDSQTLGFFTSFMARSAERHSSSLAVGSPILDSSAVRFTVPRSGG